MDGAAVAGAARPDPPPHGRGARVGCCTFNPPRTERACFPLLELKYDEARPSAAFNLYLFVRLIHQNLTIKTLQYIQSKLARCGRTGWYHHYGLCGGSILRTSALRDSPTPDPPLLRALHAADARVGKW